MLDRALNGLRMSPVPADVRKLFYKVKKAQGTDITRTFCGLNDVRNIIPSIGYAHDAGMISQCCLCITYSPIHTVEYYLDMAKKLIDAGCDEICIKDMAGIGRPVFLGKLVAGIKKIKDITIQYHSHAGPGFNMASILEVCKAGFDNWIGLEGFSYGNLMRVLVDPTRAVTLGSKGEFGWDGWLGCYMEVVPEQNMTFLMMTQKKDAGTYTLSRKIRNIIFSE
jgi:pyruvate carboxylase subunit B